MSTRALWRLVLVGTVTLGLGGDRSLWAQSCADAPPLATRTAKVSIATATTLELVAATASRSVLVCDFVLNAGDGIRSVAGTNPAAGAEITETVPADARWRLLSLSAALVTNATVANREAALVLDDGTSITLRSPTRQNQAASLTRNYSWFDGATLTTPVTDPAFTAPIAGPLLAPAHRIRTVTTNLQAGDDWSAPQFLIQEMAKVKFVEGTGANCSTGTTDVSAVFELAPLGVLRGPAGAALRTTPATALCVTNLRPVQISGVITYVVH